MLIVCYYSFFTDSVTQKQPHKSVDDIAKFI